MNDNDKKMYKDLAHEYNSSLVENQPIKQISDVQNYSNDFWNMQKYLTKMFECIPNHTGKNYHINLYL